MLSQDIKYLIIKLSNQRDEISIPYIQRKYRLGGKKAKKVYHEAMIERGKIQLLKDTA